MVSLSTAASVSQIGGTSMVKLDDSIEDGCLYQVSNGPITKPIDNVFMLRDVNEITSLDV